MKYGFIGVSSCKCMHERLASIDHRWSTPGTKTRRCSQLMKDQGEGLGKTTLQPSSKSMLPESTHVLTSIHESDCVTRFSSQALPLHARGCSVVLHSVRSHLSQASQRLGTFQHLGQQPWIIPSHLSSSDSTQTSLIISSRTSRASHVWLWIYIEKSELGSRLIGEATNINSNESSDAHHRGNILALGRNGRISRIFGVLFCGDGAGVSSHSYNAVMDVHLKAAECTQLCNILADFDAVATSASNWLADNRKAEIERLQLCIEI
ncbi:hypothetical protein KCU65_g474, partial [Aureobasidium melanogenum]